MLDVQSTTTKTARRKPARAPAVPAVQHGHFAVCIHELTIAQLVAEWRRLWNFDENDEYGGHGECRFDRIMEIEHLLSDRCAKSAEDVLQKWAALELIECTDNDYYKTIIGAFEWDGTGRGPDGWSIKAAFEKGSTQRLLRSIFEDLHSLACPEVKES